MVPPLQLSIPLMLAAAALAAGCASEPANVATPPVPAPTASTMEPSQATGPASSDGPSLRRGDLSRAHWAEQSYLLPIDGVRRLPEYSSTFAITDETARQRREFPDQSSALDVASENSTLPVVGETLLWPFFAAVDILAIGPKVLFNQQFQTVRDASGRVDRRPAALARAGFLPPYGLPAIVPVPPSILPPGEGPQQNEIPPGAWFFRDGRWYQGTRGVDYPPDAQPGEWLLRDGRWERVPDRPPPRESTTPIAPAAAAIPHAADTLPAPIAAPPASPIPPRGPVLNPDDVPVGSWIFRDGQWIQGRKPRDPR